MTSIITRAVKGAPLSYDEVDANFLNLNADKVDNSALASLVAGLSPSATIDTTNATNITSGTLDASRLANSGVIAGTYGSGTLVPAFQVDSKGRIVAVSNTVITPTFSSITGKPNTLSGYGILDAAPLNSPPLTGVPTAPTADVGVATSQIATTAFVANSFNQGEY